MTILTVDDNAFNLKLISHILESEGHSVVCARSAEDALARLAVRVPELMLLDIEMPGMDGLTLTRLLKGKAATRDLAIFIVTASAMKGDLERALASGCDDYITKPINIQEFLAKVDSLQKTLT